MVKVLEVRISSDKQVWQFRKLLKEFLTWVNLFRYFRVFEEIVSGYRGAAVLGDIVDDNFWRKSWLLSRSPSGCRVMGLVNVLSGDGYLPSVKVETPGQSVQLFAVPVG